MLEAAWFNPVVIAGKARRFSLSSDSAQRFERGVDYTLQAAAMELATQLIVEICGGQAGPIEASIAEQALPRRHPITLKNDEITRRIGRSYDLATVGAMFSRLGCEVETTDHGWTVTPPSWRFDLEIPEDLIEEVARIEGYDNVPNALPQVVYHRPESGQASEQKARETLVEQGFLEAITYSFIDRDSHHRFFGNAATVNLFNPISAEMAEMRLSLLPGLLNTLAYNRNRQQSEIRLFELGNTFVPRGERAVDCQQTYRIAGVMSGLAAPEQWGVPARALDFFDLKGVVEGVLAGVAVDFVRSSKAYLHPGQSAELQVDGQTVGEMGAIHPDTMKQFGIKGGDVWVFELEVAMLSANYRPHYQPIDRFPRVRRDLALIVDKAVSAAELEATIRASGGSLLRDMFWFDAFSGTSLPTGKKSLAIALIFQSQEKTLQDEDVESIISHLIDNLHQQNGAELR